MARDVVVHPAPEGPQAGWLLCASDGTLLPGPLGTYRFRRKADATMIARRRTSEIKRHPLYPEYWALQEVAHGIEAEMARTRALATDPDLEVISLMLEHIAFRLEDVVDNAREIAGERWREITAEVDAEIAQRLPPQA